MIWAVVVLGACVALLSAALLRQGSRLADLLVERAMLLTQLADAQESAQHWRRVAADLALPPGGNR